MRAVVIVDGELRIEERPTPAPASTEVLVEVVAAGINAADLLQRRGFYPAPPGVPADVPGLELAGRVLECGDQATRFGVGDRVMAVVGGGAQASHCVVDETHLVRVPDQVSDAEAGGLMEAFTTAHDAIFRQGRLGAGERLLVTGAAGGVGTAGVQLGHAAGARVVASVRDPKRRDEVAALGADLVIDPSEVGSHGPYDVVLELVGAASLEGGVLGALATEARVVVIGVGGGASIDLSLLGLMAARASIGGSTLRARSRTEKAQAAALVEHHVLPLFEAGALRVPLLERFALEEANAAYERFAAGGKLGKIVLEP